MLHKSTRKPSTGRRQGSGAPFEASGGSTVGGGNKYHVFTSSARFCSLSWHNRTVMLFTMPSSVAVVEQEINTLLVVVLVDLGLIIESALEVTTQLALYQEDWNLCSSYWWMVELVDLQPVLVKQHLLVVIVFSILVAQIAGVHKI